MKLFPDFTGKQAIVYLVTIFVTSVVYQIISILAKGN